MTAPITPSGILVPKIEPGEVLEALIAVHASGLTDFAVQPNGCWLWLGYKNRKGYGQVSRCDAPHRRAYEVVCGEIPSGHTLDHLCHTSDPTCDDGDGSRQPVSGVENVMRGRGFAPLKAAQEFCNAGHEFTPSNTYVRKNGTRACRECARRRARETYRRRRARSASGAAA